VCLLVECWMPSEATQHVTQKQHDSDVLVHCKIKKDFPLSYPAVCCAIALGSTALHMQHTPSTTKVALHDLPCSTTGALICCCPAS